MLPGKDTAVYLIKAPLSSSQEIKISQQDYRRIIFFFSLRARAALTINESEQTYNYYYLYIESDNQNLPSVYFQVQNNWLLVVIFG